MKYLHLLYDDTTAIDVLSSERRRALSVQLAAEVPRSPGLVAELRPIPDL